MITIQNRLLDIHRAINKGFIIDSNLKDIRSVHRAAIKYIHKYDSVNVKRKALSNTLTNNVIAQSDEFDDLFKKY